MSRCETCGKELKNGRHRCKKHSTDTKQEAKIQGSTVHGDVNTNDGTPEEKTKQEAEVRDSRIDGDVNRIRSQHDREEIDSELENLINEAVNLARKNLGAETTEDTHQLLGKLGDIQGRVTDRAENDDAWETLRDELDDARTILRSQMKSDYPIEDEVFEEDIIGTLSHLKERT